MKMSLSKSGDNLEFLAARYFQSQGYLVRRGVMLSVAAGTADATDIDLLAVRFSVPLTEERVIADCKDRRKPRPFERILWTRGLASFAHATQAIVILPRAVWQAREFAAQGGVDVLGEHEIEKLLKNYELSGHPYSDADPRLAYMRQENQDKELGRRDLELRQMLVTGHPLTNLNRIIQILSRIGNTVTDDTHKSWMRRYVCLDAAVIAGVMLVRFAADAKWTPEKDWTGYARKKLTFGDVSPQKALQLAELALDRRISEGIPSPAYTGEILELIKTLILNPQIAAHVPTTADQYLLAGVAGGPSSALKATNRETTERLRLVRRMLSALSYAAGISASLWQPSTEQNLSSKSHGGVSRLQSATPLGERGVIKDGDVSTSAENVVAGANSEFTQPRSSEAIQEMVSTRRDEVDPAAEQIWLAEAERRLEEFHSGKAQGIDAEEAFRTGREALKR